MDQSLPNRLAALALHLANRQVEAVEAASGLPASAASALVTIGAEPGTSIKTAALVAGISHSAMVRVCESLQSRGLVARQESPDGRQVALAVTPAGLALRTRILAARAAAMEGPLAGLQEPDRNALRQVVNRLLSDATTDRATGDWICRLCDEDACGADCPVDAAQRRCDPPR